MLDKHTEWFRLGWDSKGAELNSRSPSYSLYQRAAGVSNDICKMEGTHLANQPMLKLAVTVTA